MVSIHAASESVLVLTAYSNETQTCWGVLSVSRKQARPYFSGFPSTADVGTFRFKGAQNCAAANVVPAALESKQVSLTAERFGPAPEFRLCRRNPASPLAVPLRCAAVPAGALEGGPSPDTRCRHRSLRR